MESILARALEYTLKYWLKSFSRDQFKLQGRIAELSNLDINGDALHSSIGLPPALNVTTATVGKLEIVLPSMSNVQVEPIIVQIDTLDLVLEENLDEACRRSSSSQSSSSSSKGSGYGFADKIADGMTVEIRTVNLLLETRGGAGREGGASWASPLASITMRNLLLYTTNENWKVVNLKEAREFSANTKFIYVFKKLEWQSLSVDLLPHPDMFMDSNLARAQEGGSHRDNDGAKRAFFGGERFIEGISGEAHITVQRTESNSPLGLEVQLHIMEAVCPALSEPGLRALLRFLTGLYVCINRGDVAPKFHQRSVEAAGRSIVSIVVDHIFLCIKDADFQLELLMQSLFFSRVSVSDGENDNNLTKVMIGGLFLRDTFSRPPCTLFQPSMQAAIKDPVQVPEFGKNFCPPIYPLGDQRWQTMDVVPLFCLHSIQTKPSPVPPSFASQTVINCQPIMIHLQEDTCLRIFSFLADGIVVNPGDVLPDFSINSFALIMKELDVTVPLDASKMSNSATNMDSIAPNSFSGARLHIQNLFFSESPTLHLGLLNLEKDPACFSFWEDQPVDASQKRCTTRASHLSLSLETCCGLSQLQTLDWSSGLWRCVELKDVRTEVAMATADGSPLTNVPPAGGVVRVGVACEQYLSNTSVEQLFFVLYLYAYLGRVSEKIVLVGKSTRQNRCVNESSHGKLMYKVPSDTGVSLVVKDLQIRFLESSSMNIQGIPLVQFIGNDLFIKVTHTTLGGAIAVTSTVCWDHVRVDCVDAKENLTCKSEMEPTSSGNHLLMGGGESPLLKSVLWIHHSNNHQSDGTIFGEPFLCVRIVHVIPLSAVDMEFHSLNVGACISGVRLGGGLNYTESLLHRFGIFGPDGGPGEGLSKGLDHLHSGPFLKLFKTSPLVVGSLEDGGNSGYEKESHLLHLGKPDDVDVSIELKNWLFALEGEKEMAECLWSYNHEDVVREERSWHTTFQNLGVKAKSNSKHLLNGKSGGRKQYPVELVMIGVQGLQILKPQAQMGIQSAVLPENGIKGTSETSGGIDVEVRMMISENSFDDGIVHWIVDNVKFSAKQPIEAIVTKDELQHLAILCKSEVDSMGRITAGILRLLKLEGSIGQAAIDQLSNLDLAGTEGIDKIFSPKHSRCSSPCHIPQSPSSAMIGGSPRFTLESTVASLEEAITDLQAKCAALVTDMGCSDSSLQLHFAAVKQLGQKLQSMQSLLTRLRTQTQM